MTHSIKLVGFALARRAYPLKSSDFGPPFVRERVGCQSKIPIIWNMLGPLPNSSLTHSTQEGEGVGDKNCCWGWSSYSIVMKPSQTLRKWILISRCWPYWPCKLNKNHLLKDCGGGDRPLGRVLHRSVHVRGHALWSIWLRPSTTKMKRRGTMDTPDV